MPDGAGQSFQACVRTPFATLGIMATATHLTAIRFLPASVAAKVPKRNSIAHLACVQLQAYLDDPAFLFDVPIKLAGIDVYEERIETLVAAMLEDPGVRLPGERRRANRDRAEREGVSVPADLLGKIRALAGEGTHA